MFIMHIALQGCLKPAPVDYGVTADTGGHIRYLLDLVAHTTGRPEVTRQEVVTRAFEEPRLGAVYAQPRQRLDAKTDIVRIKGRKSGYLPKEALHAEHGALAAGLIRHIEALPERPSLLHAHYADGGDVARRVSSALGIPYLFTAHSLGRVKAQACCAGGAVPAEGELARRVAMEERVIAGAAAIVASSRDEAEAQYPLYDAHDPARITVNPPGGHMTPSDVEAARARVPALTEDLSRFLQRPDKPCLLALARPVEKKNLSGLIEAYASSAALRDAANLVIYAGCRDDLHEQEDEKRAVLEELLHLVDRHDLYGRAALPKTHEPDDVPAIYALAASRGGVFVNPALSEPFGLTLLEAAAAGLPVVATRHGGPADIVGRCRNGVLVDPQSPDDIASAALALISDRGRWEACAEAGRAACGYYDWRRHARDYAALAARITRPAAALGRARPLRRPFLLASDVDDTLTGDAAAVEAFRRWREADEEHVFAIATGRTLHAAIGVLKDWDVPVPDILITAVGAEIYHRCGAGWALKADRAWAGTIEKGWDRAAVASEAAAVPGLAPQGQAEQRPFKLSYFWEEGPGIAALLAERLAKRGLCANIVFSHGRMVDILPRRASKGLALRHVRRRLGIERAHVIAAGDSGNDITLLEEAAHPVAVANHKSELKELLSQGRTFVSEERYAAGVLDGIAVFHRDRRRAAAAPRRARHEDLSHVTTPRAFHHS